MVSGKYTAKEMKDYISEQTQNDDKAGCSVILKDKTHGEDKMVMNI